MKIKLVNAVARDNEGYLLCPDDWNETIAFEIAEELNIKLDERHWLVVNFIRQYFEDNQTVAEARVLLKYLKAEGLAGCTSSKQLYLLFPYGYGQQACKIAGMRKPLKLMLDV